jgi:hypothetical protein
MRRQATAGLASLAAVVTLIGVVIAAAATSPSAAPAASSPPATVASCAGLTHREQFARARVVADGRMLRGPAGRQGVLFSPARIKVARYLKGHGPRILRVQTAIRRTATGIAGNDAGIEPAGGQRWLIYASRSRQPLATSICAGSRRLSG